MITQKAFAKLNFNLHVLPELLPNGYHQIIFLNFECNLSDTLTLSEIPKGIILTCDNPDLAVDETNLAYKSAKLMIRGSHIGGAINKGVKVEIKKQIPIAGGLGGGSTDGAAVILGLNKLWNLNLSDQEKINLAEKLGMDVCYSVIGGVCKITGAGEIVEPIDAAFPGINLLIVSPEVTKPSTGWAFTVLDLSKVGKHLHKLPKMVKALKEKKLIEIAKNLHNDFEKPIIREFPEVGQIKAKMMENGAMGTNMSGAGLSVFGIFDTEKSAKKAFLKLKKEYPKTFICKTI